MSVMVTRATLKRAKELRKNGVPIQPVKFPEGFRDRGDLVKEKSREIIASLSR